MSGEYCRVGLTPTAINGVTFYNLTPHVITIVTTEGERLSIPPCGQVARVKTNPGEDLDPIGKVIPTRTPPVMGEVEGLPEPFSFSIYIVSQIVASVARRPDVYYPDTGSDCIRDEKGNIEAVRRLIRSI
jgi:hypothetical protein